jgi:hypothetical protein
VFTIFTERTSMADNYYTVKIQDAIKSNTGLEPSAQKICDALRRLARSLDKKNKEFCAFLNEKKRDLDGMD